MSKLREQLEFNILTNLIDEIGIQVTRDYKSKNGIWEGLSVSNANRRRVATDSLMELVESYAKDKAMEWVGEEKTREQVEKIINPDRVGSGYTIESPGNDGNRQLIWEVSGYNKAKKEIKQKIQGEDK